MSTTMNAPATFPSIFELGRLAAAVESRATVYGDSPAFTLEKQQDGGCLCLDLLENIQHIIASRRAETLSDVAAQLVTMFTLIDGLDSFDDITAAERALALRLLRRIVLSSIPVVATEGGVDLAALTNADLVRYADKEFLPVTKAEASKAVRSKADA